MSRTQDEEAAVVACADLVKRAGASRFEAGFEVGRTHEEGPAETASWYARAAYRGVDLVARDHRSAAEACEALARRILEGGRCRCGRPGVLTALEAGCLWRREGRVWVSSCDAPSVRVEGRRGDLEAMRRAMTEREQDRPW